MANRLHQKPSHSIGGRISLLIRRCESECQFVQPELEGIRYEPFSRGPKICAIRGFPSTVRSDEHVEPLQGWSVQLPDSFEVPDRNANNHGSPPWTSSSAWSACVPIHQGMNEDGNESQSPPTRPSVRAIEMYRAHAAIHDTAAVPHPSRAPSSIHRRLRFHANRSMKSRMVGSCDERSSSGSPWKYMTPSCMSATLWAMV